MIIEKKEHQQFILELIKNVQVPGHLLDLAYEVKKAVEGAEINDDGNKPDINRTVAA